MGYKTNFTNHGRSLLPNTVKPVFKDHSWEKNSVVSFHRWTLITGSFVKKSRNWEINSVVAKDRKLLNKGVLKYRFDFTVREIILLDEFLRLS